MHFMAQRVSTPAVFQASGGTALAASGAALLQAIQQFRKSSDLSATWTGSSSQAHEQRVAKLMNAASRVIQAISRGQAVTAGGSTTMQTLKTQNDATVASAVAGRFVVLPSGQVVPGPEHYASATGPHGAALMKMYWMIAKMYTGQINANVATSTMTDGQVAAQLASIALEFFADLIGNKGSGGPNPADMQMPASTLPAGPGQFEMPPEGPGITTPGAGTGLAGVGTGPGLGGFPGGPGFPGGGPGGTTGLGGISGPGGTPGLGGPGGLGGGPGGPMGGMVGGVPIGGAGAAGVAGRGGAGMPGRGGVGGVGGVIPGAAGAAGGRGGSPGVIGAGGAAGTGTGGGRGGSGGSGGPGSPGGGRGGAGGAGGMTPMVPMGSSAANNDDRPDAHTWLREDDNPFDPGDAPDSVLS